MKPTAVMAALMLLHGNAAGSQLERGEYLLHAGGCITCHTADEDDAEALAGGHALDTPFGTFFSPNITPDVDTGIGDWTDEAFVDALWHGIAPDGSRYYPAFPYTSYTGISRDDALAIKAYLFSLDPVRRENREHELDWYLFSRFAARAWQWLNFRPARFAPDPDRDDQWNRGAYLVRHLGHCGECHTPRNVLGRLNADRELAGNSAGPGGKKVPNITPHPDYGIGKWSAEDTEFFLEIGMLPDGDFTGGSMSPVIDENTGMLTADDRAAIVIYLRSLEPADP